MNRILYYALGGGLGHVVRTVALARQLARLGGDHVVLVNTPFVDAVRRISEVETGIQIHSIPATFDAEAVRKIIVGLQTDMQPDVLVVDTFPRGIGGELVKMLESTKHILRVLVSRTLPVQYVETFRLGDFVGLHFDVVIAPGETGGIGPDLITSDLEQHVKFCSTDPFLIRDWNELPSRVEAAKKLQTDASRKTVLLVGSGSQAECEEAKLLFDRVNETLRQRKINVQTKLIMPVDLTAHETGNFHWPLIECLPAVDLVIGSAGYNLFWETESLQRPTLLQPRKRQYDCQQRRTTQAGTVTVESIIDRIVASSIQPALPPFINGASSSARIIADCYEDGISSSTRATSPCIRM